MSSGNKKVTVGYRYYAGMHLVLCHGPVDRLNRIMVGEREAWSGAVESSQQIAINAPELFGGKKREGGIVGAVDVAFGTAGQAQNDYLAGLLGAAVPAFRGVTALVLRQVELACNNPYIKPWSAELTRTLAQSGGGTQWYSAKADIGGNMNPAHIVRECLCDTAWGRSYSDAELDDAAFRAAADTLYAEGFGLSLLWDQQQDLDAFIEDILQHIDGSLYVSPRTGLFVLKLARDDYDPEAAFVLGESNIVALESFGRTLPEELVNQVTLTYHDRASDKLLSIAVQDIAGIARAGGEIKDTALAFAGIANGTLAARVAMRELRQLGLPLARATLVANRTAAGLAIGDVVRLVWPELGIAGLLLRVAQISYGTLADGRVRIECVEDIFALPSAAYLVPQPSGWEDPRQPPLEANFRYLGELPYWSIVREITGESATALGEIDPDDGLLAVAAVRPTTASIDFEVQRRQGTAAFAAVGRGDFCPSCTLVGDVDQAQSVFDFLSGVDLDLVDLHTYAALGTELVAVRALDLEANRITMDRGVLDTVPAAHVAGTRLYFIEGAQAYDTERFLSGEEVDVKVLPATGLGQIDPALVATDTYTFAARWSRPYPPGKVQVNGQGYAIAYLTGALATSWVHRDRTAQTAYLVAQDEDSIGPEPGTTYTVRVYGEADTLVHTEAGLTGTDWTYALEDEASESGLGRPNESLRVTFETLRDGYASWQRQEIGVPECRGYGMFYGAYYGE